MVFQDLVALKIEEVVQQRQLNLEKLQSSTHQSQIKKYQDVLRFLDGKLDALNDMKRSVTPLYSEDDLEEIISMLYISNKIHGLQYNKVRQRYG